MKIQAPDCKRRMVDFLCYVELKREPCVFSALDARKAFDKVHWGYLA